jgi:hypothetical protein
MGAEQSVDRKEAVELMDGTSSLTSADTSGTLASSESSDPAAHSLGDLVAPSLPNKCAVVAVDAHALMTSVVGSHALFVLRASSVETSCYVRRLRTVTAGLKQLRSC